MKNEFNLHKRIFSVMVLLVLFWIAIASVISFLDIGKTNHGAETSLLSNPLFSEIVGRDIVTFIAMLCLFAISIVMFCVGMIFSKVSRRRNLILFLALYAFFYALAKFHFYSRLIFDDENKQMIEVIFFVVLGLTCLSLNMFLRQLENGVTTTSVHRTRLPIFFYMFFVGVLLLIIISVFTRVELARMGVVLYALLLAMLVHILFFIWQNKQRLKYGKEIAYTMVIFLIFAIADLCIYARLDTFTKIAPFTTFGTFFVTGGIWIFLLREIYIGIEETNDMRAQLMESKVALMLSQIRPHFIYNVLNSINILIKQDPEQAQNMIKNFSAYLRKNMNAMNEASGLIEFSEELEHVKAYAEIEKIRFPKLKVQYEIDEMDFSVPMLSVEPLVENAIKYGAARKREGGQVIIRAYRSKQFIYIEVRDNGEGFDTQATLSAETGSLGIKNVIYRVETMTGGEVSIKSKIDEGTIATIKLPVERVKE